MLLPTTKREEWPSHTRDSRYRSDMAIATSPDLSDIDLTDLETFVDRTPHDWFKRLRDDAPCFWNAEAGGRGFWSVTR